jgi:hypothetical protein
MFAEERLALEPLPLEPFHYYYYGERTVHLDGCVEVEAAYYSAPPGWIGRRIRVQWDALHVRLLDPLSGQLLREHLRQPRGCHRIKDEDRSRKTPLSTCQLLARAERAGAHIGRLCHTMYQGAGQVAIRRILGVLALAKKHGAPAVEEACSAALEIGLCEYRFVRRYLERTPTTPTILRQVDPLIRQLTLYRDLIQQTTQEKRTVNVIELQRSLRQLRLGAMAAVLETRLRQAQAEPMAPIDLIGCVATTPIQTEWIQCVLFGMPVFTGIRTMLHGNSTSENPYLQHIRHWCSGKNISCRPIRQLQLSSVRLCNRTSGLCQARCLARDMRRP